MILAFVLGILLGLAFAAGPRWRKRYRQEAQARAEEKRLHLQERKRWAIEAQQLKEYRRRQESLDAGEQPRREERNAA
jgi:hypothetical protein